jgi:hypothetical protein
MLPSVIAIRKIAMGRTLRALPAVCPANLVMSCVAHKGAPFG